MGLGFHKATEVGKGRICSSSHHSAFVIESEDAKVRGIDGDSECSGIKTWRLLNYVLRHAGLCNDDPAEEAAKRWIGRGDFRDRQGNARQVTGDEGPGKGSSRE